MYAGQVVEEADVTELFDRPFHPYTQGLLQSMPRSDQHQSGNVRRLHEIPGTVPSLLDPIDGCKFADRCPHTFDTCRLREPALEPVESRHYARCWLKSFPQRRKNDV